MGDSTSALAAASRLERAQWRALHGVRQVLSERALHPMMPWVLSGLPEATDPVALAFTICASRREEIISCRRDIMPWLKPTETLGDVTYMTQPIMEHALSRYAHGALVALLLQVGDADTPAVLRMTALATLARQNHFTSTLKFMIGLGAHNLSAAWRPI
ncbi:MAG: hypothetical protein SGPRY_001959 [Prymnesium sp.]